MWYPPCTPALATLCSSTAEGQRRSTRWGTRRREGLQPAATASAIALFSLSERPHRCEVSKRPCDCTAMEPVKRVNSLLAVSHTKAKTARTGLQPRKSTEQTLKRQPIPQGPHFSLQPRTSGQHLCCQSPEQEGCDRAVVLLSSCPRLSPSSVFRLGVRQLQEAGATCLPSPGPRVVTSSRRR